LLYSDSSPITSPIYTSGKYERLSSSSLFTPHIDLPSPYDHFPDLHSHHSEIVKSLVDQSFEVFDNLLFSPRISSPRISMVGVGGVGTGGSGGGGDGGQENISVQPPRIFSKVVFRYAPLALLVILHDLPKKYMKSLSKFTVEVDWTTIEHIVFFYQY
jgi:hypothetical protein